jgi:hypothetical protein
MFLGYKIPKPTFEIKPTFLVFKLLWMNVNVVKLVFTKNVNVFARDIFYTSLLNLGLDWTTFRYGGYCAYKHIHSPKLTYYYIVII